LFLTRDQVQRYRLPSVPLKGTDRRGPGFLERYGCDATELDALEELHPGELEKIVRKAVRPYRDPKLERDSISAASGLPRPPPSNGSRPRKCTGSVSGPSVTGPVRIGD
jgi:hypothetical protein